MTAKDIEKQKKIETKQKEKEKEKKGVKVTKIEGSQKKEEKEESQETIKDEINKLLDSKNKRILDRYTQIDNIRRLLKDSNLINEEVTIRMKLLLANAIVR